MPHTGQNPANRHFHGVKTNVAPKLRAKLFNMQVISETIDQLIAELNKQAKRQPDLAEAVECLRQAKQCISAYSDKLLSNPSETVQPYDYVRAISRKSAKGRYNDFHRQGGFDDASTIFENQRQAQLEKQILKEQSQVGKKKPSGSGGGNGPCHDKNGQFTDC